MSIYIKGMELPRTCRDCPLEQPYDGYNCAITGQSYSWALTDRPSGCPLVPVPPHGRLIDADALIKALGIGDLPIRITYEIINAPTIIPAEEGDT